MILKGFAVYAEAAVVVEVEGVGVSVWGGWGGPWWVVGLSGECCQLKALGCGDGLRSFAALRMTGGVGVGRLRLGKSRFLSPLGMTIHRHFDGL